MSVQLIVYPQSYEGSPNTLSGNFTNFLVDSKAFTTVNAQTPLLFSNLTAAILHFDTANTVNQWGRYGGAISPTENNNGALIFLEDNGIIQKLSNLSVGITYDVTINILNSTGTGTSTMDISIYTGTVFDSVSSITLANASSSYTVSFTATATTQTIAFSYNQAGTDNTQVDSFGLFPSVVSPSLNNGQVILDLYEDEDLPLTLSVDDFKNVAEKVQSYSKAFNLPATKRNNKIFDQVFEVTRYLEGGSPSFNPYRKTKCVLKQDGFILFEGYLRMLDITDKLGEISYNVNLYSEVIALADFLKDSSFRDLDFTELTHDYNRTEIVNSWNDSGQGIVYTNPSTSIYRNAYDTVKYPFVDWNKQMLIANGSTGSTAVLDNVELTQLEQAFRPWINVKYLIDRIFEGIPFTYSSKFFGSNDFKKLYMDFNWGSDNTPTSIDTNGIAATVYPYNVLATSSWQTMPQDDNNYTTEMGYSAGVYTAINDSQSYTIDYNFRLYSYQIPSGTALPYDMDFRWELVKSGVTTYINQFTISGTGDMFWNYWIGNLSELLDVGDTLTPQFKTTTASTHNSSHMDQNSSNGDTIAITSAPSITTDIFLQTLRGELGQWDFLKGLITMFNLVTLPDEDNPNNIVIEPYADVFINSADSVQLNWTDKIDVSEMKLEPLTDLNKKTIFKFVEDDDDYSFNQYKNSVGGHLYGSKKFNAGNEFNILDGEEEIIAEPFAATVVKALFPNYPDFITPAMYSYSPDDDTTEGFDNSPRIMYNNGIKATNSSYYIPAQNGVTYDQETDYLQFSHIKDGGLAISGYTDFNFGWNQLLPGVGAGTVNNLFNTYWLPYYSELYNINTRTMTIKVNLTPADINTFKFNDRVMIKNRVFRVNKIDYKPNDLATVEFILIP